MKVLLAAALCLCACHKSKPADWPDRYSLVTVQSGHTYKVLQITPVTGHGGQRQGLGISYIGYARNFGELTAAAQELFEFAKAQAEVGNDPTIAVVAKLGFDPNAKVTQSTDWNLVFKKGPGGQWERLKQHDDAPFPDLPKRDDTDERDVRAQKEVASNVDEFLGQVDKGHVDKTWDELAPAVKKTVSREDWTRKVGERRTPLGELQGRQKFAVVQTTGIGNAPRGHYIITRFHGRFAKKEVAEEVVTEMLADDGKWHLVGYAIN
jgi:uncharacterized protein DUF4019